MQPAILFEAQAHGSSEARMQIRDVDSNCFQNHKSSSF